MVGEVVDERDRPHFGPFGQAEEEEAAAMLGFVVSECAVKNSRVGFIFGASIEYTWAKGRFIVDELRVFDHCVGLAMFAVVEKSAATVDGPVAGESTVGEGRIGFTVVTIVEKGTTFKGKIVEEQTVAERGVGYDPDARTVVVEATTGTEWVTCRFAGICVAVRDDEAVQDGCRANCMRQYDGVGVVVIGVGQANVATQVGWVLLPFALAWAFFRSFKTTEQFDAVRDVEGNGAVV